MNPQEREAIDGLSPESATLVETYFARVHGALLVAAADECEETVEDLRAHVYEELAETAGTAADVARVLAKLGPPEELAMQCTDAVGAPTPSEEPGRSPFSGTLLGIPYELRMPTGERAALRWWDPLNANFLVPRVFGLGWDLNLAAIAVRLGLIRPDDEDVPFASVPGRWLAASAALPVLAATALVTLVVRFQGQLPPLVAVHWGITGTPDNFASKESALVFPLVMTMIGLAALGAAWLRRRPPLSRVGAAALATVLCWISAAAYVQEVATAFGASGSKVVLAGIALALVATFVMLVTLARIGRAAEVRRDLDDTSKKGRV